MLTTTGGPLAAGYDTAVLDLDGVVYVGCEAVPGAPEALRAVRAAGMQLAFVTNNAARTPAAVAGHLNELGIECTALDVVTSAQAAARLLADMVPTGSRVYLMGGDGLEVALREQGLEPVTAPADGPVAVAQGFGPDLPWRRVVDGTILVKEGLPWVVSNTDLTLPTGSGTGPGTGTLVRLVADFTGREPQVAGKPQRPLYEETILRVGGSHPLVVGDRIDTDIEGALRMGWPSMLVMSGVTALHELVRVPESLRPTYIGADLSALTLPANAPTRTGSGWELDGWSASVSEGVLEVDGTGTSHDWYRVLAGAAWQHLDSHGRPVELGHLSVPGSVAP